MPRLNYSSSCLRDVFHEATFHKTIDFAPCQLSSFRSRFVITHGDRHAREAFTNARVTRVILPRRVSRYHCIERNIDQGLRDEPINSFRNCAPMKRERNKRYVDLVPLQFKFLDRSCDFPENLSVRARAYREREREREREEIIDNLVA